MGIDVDGKMIVGAHRSKLSIDCDDIHDWCEDHGMDYASPYYDAPDDELTIGFDVKNVMAEDIDDWVVNVKEKAKRFKEITGVDAELIGMQDVW